jgi:hypothetical protein
VRVHRRRALPVLAVSVVVLLPPAQGAASFPGVNGRIAYDHDLSSRYFGVVRAGHAAPQRANRLSVHE